MANAHSIQLEIVTPEGVMLSENVDEFVAPGLKGEFGVVLLKQHGLMVVTERH